jgi:nucleoside diphosphate kinase
MSSESQTILNQINTFQAEHSTVSGDYKKSNAQATIHIYLTNEANTKPKNIVYYAKKT